MLREYLVMGDLEFSKKYAMRYIESVAKTPEHAKSLARLCVTRPDGQPGFFAVSSTRVDRRALQLLRNEAIRRDWHKRLAKQVAINSPWVQSYSYCRGYLQRHGHMGKDLSNSTTDKPVFLMIHGFGGSLDQCTSLALQLQMHFEVHALDSLGFGRSEKPPLSYNQYIWRDQVVEYLQDLAQRRNAQSGKVNDTLQIVLGGNSIGGYTAASVAAAITAYSADALQRGHVPLLNCTGLVLFNSAGVIVNNTGIDTSTVPEGIAFPPYRGPSNRVLSIVGNVLTTVLRGSIERTCRWLYPTNPDYVVTSGLVQQIYRDSCDPGAAGVFASGAKLPTPRTMNSLLGEYCGPVLVAQGTLDPLGDVVAKAFAFGTIRKDIKVDLLPLGHCPMDENAELASSSVLKWAREVGILPLNNDLAV